MKILITGATGLVGRSLTRRLSRKHEVRVLSRDPARARRTLGVDVAAFSMDQLDQAVQGTDAIVHLAGENIADKRWTDEQKRALAASRVELTRDLVDAIGRASQRPSVLVSASAIGWYGNTGARPVAEDEPPAPTFLGGLCAAWESEAERAGTFGLRVATLRIGVVLDTEGGALAKLLPLFRLGLGARLGDGSQFFSWIHLDDLLRIIELGVEDDRMSGTYNATAETPVDNRTFTARLAAAVGRPAPFVAPGFAVKVLLGEAAEVVLSSQRVVPARLLSHGFRFTYPTLDGALEELVTRHERGVSITPTSEVPSGAEGLPRPQYVLTQETTFPVPLATLFPFFARAENLGALTPPFMHWRIEGTPPEPLHAGAPIVYRIKLGLFPMRWRTSIKVWEPPARFVDNQERGPYALWWHEHSFREEGGRTTMIDRVHYRLPFGFLGRLVHPFVIGPLLRRIFAYRGRAMQERFGAESAVAARPQSRTPALVQRAG